MYIAKKLIEVLHKSYALSKLNFKESYTAM